MRRLGTTLAAASVLALTTTSAANAPYAKDARTAYIEETILALRDTPDDVLRGMFEEARTALHGACAAGSERLRVECLVVTVERKCSDARCKRAMDVAVACALAEERLVSREQRAEIVRTSGSHWRSALARELRHVQGRLAVDFRVHAPNATRDTHTLAAAIDHFCLTTADETSISYPTCVASLLSYTRGVP